MRLKQPLDFFMLTDHSEMFGAAPILTQQGSPAYHTGVAKLVQQGEATKTFSMISSAIIEGKPMEGLGGPEVAKSIWSRYIEYA